MAIGIVIGAAFSTIVKSFVDDIIMPVVGAVTGGVDFSNMFVTIKESADGVAHTTVAAASEAGAITVNYGLFINAVVTFVIVAFVLFMVIKGMNKAKEAVAKEEAEEAAKPAEPSDEAKLLAEIRDALASK